MNKKTIEKNVFKISIFLSLGFFLIFWILGIIKGNYWIYLIYGKSYLGDYQVFLLFLISLTSLYNLILIFKNKKKINITCLILSLGFLYLTLDENFGIHKKIKINILLILLMILGILFTPIVLKEISKNKNSIKYFILAIIFSIIAIFIDSLHYYKIKNLLELIEEIFETSGMIFFFNSFFLISLEEKFKEIEKN